MTESTESENNEEISESAAEEGTENSAAPKKPGLGSRVLFLGLTAVCFAYLYYRLNGAAIREGLTLTTYMTEVFANVAWLPWLGLMIGYSLFYFAIDTLVVTRALNWFLADIKYKDINNIM